MRVLGIGIVALSVLAAGEASAADKKAAADPKERVVCQNEMVTGTRFSKRICKSAREWEEAEERSRDALREQMSRPVINRQGEAPNGIGE